MTWRSPSAQVCYGDLTEEAAQVEPLDSIRRWSRSSRRPAAVHRWAVAVLLGAAIGTYALPTAAAARVDAPTQLNATDLALLQGVRLAGLWEMPAGQMAAEKGSRTRVREIGAEIAAQHVELDELVVEAANNLGASLPGEPNADQKKWLSEMEKSSGARFDRIFVDRLRAAHGKIFPVIGAVRAGTRNAEIRKLAQAANSFVMNHLTMLESTGLVRYTDLPPAAVPAPQENSLLTRARANAGTGGAGSGSFMVWGVLLGAVIVAGIASWRLVRR